MPGSAGHSRRTILLYKLRPPIFDFRPNTNITAVVDGIRTRYLSLKNHQQFTHQIEQWSIECKDLSPTEYDLDDDPGETRILDLKFHLRKKFIKIGKKNRFFFWKLEKKLYLNLNTWEVIKCNTCNFLLRQAMNNHQ